VQRPLVFMLITSTSTNHGGATLHLSYHTYQLAADLSSSGSSGVSTTTTTPTPCALQPVELQVINLGKVLSAAHGFPPFQAPALAAALGGGGLPSAVERRLRDAVGGAAGEAAEAVCAAMLGELREVSDRVGAGGAALAAAKERNERLMQRLAAYSGDSGGLGIGGR